MNDFEGAKHYALQRLNHELAPTLTYHSIEHTRDDVVPAAEKLAKMEGFSDDDVLLLVTAAWFHDLGYIERYVNNEDIAVRIAEEILPGFGYSTPQIQVIGGIIMATRLPQSPKTRLEAVMSDADLTSLGIEAFVDRQKALRSEFATYSSSFSDAGWYAYQIAFLEKHSYFTESARRLYNAQKQANMDMLRQWLAAASVDSMPEID